MSRILIDKTGQVLNKNELNQDGETLSALEVIEMFKNGEITLKELMESCPEVEKVEKVENKETPTTSLGQSRFVNEEPESKTTAPKIIIDKDGNILNENSLLDMSITNDRLQEILRYIELYKRHEIGYIELTGYFPEVVRVDELQKTHPNHSDTPLKKQRTGKLYAIGDIHGKWKAYQTAMEMTSPEDRVVILGDVIDRGSDGIKILQDIMKRKNVEFILGNHEYMMLEALNVIKEYNLSLEDCINILEPYYSFIMKMPEMSSKGIQQRTSELEKAGIKEELLNIQKKIKQQGKVYEEKKIQSIGVWISTANGGKSTLSSILKLPEDEQKQIYDYLCNAYIMLCEKTKEQDILFVHAQPSQDLNSIKRIHSNYSGIKYREMSRQDIYPMVWSRREQDGEDTYIKCKEEGLLTICGHEPEHANIVQNWNNGYICLDANSGRGGRVALYDVENDSLELIYEDGTIDNKKMNIRTWN